MAILEPIDHDPYTTEPVDHNPFEPIPLSQTAGRVDAPWRPDQIAPPPQHLTSMANNPIAHGIGEAILSPITEAGEYVGGLMQGTTPFEPGEAVKEGLKLGSAFIGPKMGGGSAAAGAAKLAPLLGMFAGPMAETADRGALRLAQQMAEKGMDRRQIWDATGWFTGADNKWRFEIPDHGLQVRAGEGQGLVNPENAIRHPAVEDAYSQLDNLTHDVRIDSKLPVGGEFFPRSAQRPEGHISLNATTQPQARSIVAHEIQHPIQRIEGFSTGANPDSFGDAAKNALVEHGIDPNINPDLIKWSAMETYRRHAGEVEARNVQRRLPMTPEMRKSIPPWTTEDVPRDQQIVRGDANRRDAMVGNSSPISQTMKLYHGTDENIVGDFDLSKAGANFGDAASRQGVAFFTENKKLANHYGRNILERNITFNNPKHIDVESALRDDYQIAVKKGDFGGGFNEYVSDYLEGNPYAYYETGRLSTDIKDAKLSGHDGIILDFGKLHDSDFGRLNRAAIAFDAKQITNVKADQKFVNGIRLDPVDFDPFVVPK